MRVLLGGYYGFGNIGDEAILAAVAEGLRAALADVELKVLSADVQHTRRVHDLEATDRWRLGSVLAALRWCQAFVLGGGGLIQDATSSLSPAYYLGLLALARWLRRPSLLLAQGVGPLQGALWRRMTAGAFAAAAYASVRDEASAQALRQWGLRGEVPVVADPVFALTPAPADAAEQWLAEQGVEVPPSAPVVVPRALEGYEEVLAKAVQVLSASGSQVLVLPFQASDEELAGRLAEGSPGAMAAPAPQDPRLAAALVGRAGCVVAMRLHAVIFAALARRPAVGIAYDPKVARQCEALGYQYLGADGAEEVSRWARRVEDGEALGPAAEQVEVFEASAREGLQAAAQVLSRLAQASYNEPPVSGANP